MKYNYYLNMKTFYCVCGCVWGCVCMCVCTYEIFPWPRTVIYLFIYLFIYAFFIQGSTIQWKHCFPRTRWPWYKMLQLKKQIYACTVNNNNLSQELYSFNITLGSILQHFITMYKIVNMIIIIIATIHACNCCKHAYTDTWVCFQFDHIVYVLYTAH